MASSIPPRDIIRILEEIALLLELKGESPFKSLAYTNAARKLETLEEDLDGLVRRGGLKSVRGIGDALNRKITELVATGRLEYYETLKASVPQGLLEMLRIPGLGPRKIRALHEKLSPSGHWENWNTPAWKTASSNCPASGPAPSRRS